MRTLNLNPLPSFLSTVAFTVLFGILLFSSCDKADITEHASEIVTRANAMEHSIDLVPFLENMDEVEVTISTRSSGYDALAKGHGTVPTGQYAGHHFTVAISAFYSAVGIATLVSGEATVRIRSQHFESVEICAPPFASFCSGEGSLWDLGTHWEFDVYGQVEHLRAATPHNHLFAGFGSTAGTMNFNILNQTGSVTDHGGPNHDPDIGLIEEIQAQPVYVRLH